MVRQRWSETARRRVDSGAACEALSAPIQSLAVEQELLGVALDSLRRAGADYGDARLGRDHERSMVLVDQSVRHHQQDVSAGIGIRALYKGFWGFAATPDLTAAGVRAAADRAVGLAKAVADSSPAAAGLQMRDWAPEPPHQAEFHTPVGICPFAASADELAAESRGAAAIGSALPAVKRIVSSIDVFGRRRWFASTEGARILTTHVVIDPSLRVVAVDNGTSGYRTLCGQGAMAGGLEHLLAADFPARITQAAAEARQKCAASAPAPGSYDLILDSANLALTIHESIGHPTELDRVLGYELGFAGGSYATPDRLGNLRIGSALVNFTADNTIPYGAATTGYDDEGVLCRRFDVVKEGLLAGYGMNRETACRVGAPAANGTTRATNWYDVPIVRIPNLFLEPGRDALTLEALIADTRAGILMCGRDSFSIDQQRLNFQFGADMCWRIENGRLTEPLRDVIYQSISTEFWQACDAVCDRSAWQAHGIFNCGKGQPAQAGKMLHGAAPARFRNIRVGW